jgi:hypothetical protein
MTPQERRRLARQRAASGDATAPEAATTPETGVKSPPSSEPRKPIGPKPRPKRRQWAKETRWYECLLYPFRAGLLILRLAALFTALSACLVPLVPLVLGNSQFDPPPGPLVPWLISAPYLLVSFFVVGYTCGFLHCVLAFGAVGEATELGFRGQDHRLVLKIAVRWLLCFLAGPVAPASAAVLYWFYGGDPGVLDWTIIAELGVVAVGWWLLTVLAVNQRDRLLDANPVRVAEVVRSLGFRILLIAGAAGALTLGHGLVAFGALEQLHNNVGIGLGWLILCWISLLSWATFLFRLLGLWCHQSPWWAIGRPSETSLEPNLS